jgi:hypothetical protein
MQPLSGSFPNEAELAAGEPRWPLRAAVCPTCWWMQLADDTPDEPDVGGPSAATVSSTIRSHADELVRWLRDELGIPPGARAIELASHGNIIAPLLREAGLRTTTVEGHPSAIAAARAAGLDVVEGLLTPELAARLAAPQGADLVLDTFMLSHVRSPRRQLEAFAAAIGPRGLAVVELDHAMPLLTDARFDAIRHGHFSYVSISALVRAAATVGLRVVAVSKLPVYGGVVRAVLSTGDESRATGSVGRLLAEEAAAGVTALPLYDSFAGRVAGAIEGLRSHLHAARAAGRSVAAYGAPTRGNTLLNAAGIGPDLIAYTADASPAKQGRFLPGSHLPIVSPETLMRRRPDEVVILTWDIADEVVGQLTAGGGWGCRFVIPMPEVRLLAT